MCPLPIAHADAHAHVHVSGQLGHREAHRSTQLARGEGAPLGEALESIDEEGACEHILLIVHRHLNA